MQIVAAHCQNTVHASSGNVEIKHLSEEVCDFCSLVVDSRRAGLSSSKIAYLFGISDSTVPGVYTESNQFLGRILL